VKNGKVKFGKKRKGGGGLQHRGRVCDNHKKGGLKKMFPLPQGVGKGDVHTRTRPKKCISRKKVSTGVLPTS